MKEAQGKGAAERRAQAQERQAARAARSDQEQLRLLNLRPGKSARERARLEAKLKDSQKKERKNS